MNKKNSTVSEGAIGRRSFTMRLGIASAAAALPAGALLTSQTRANAFDIVRSNSRLSEGDAAILRFLAAAELIEADLWTQPFTASIVITTGRARIRLATFSHRWPRATLINEMDFEGFMFPP